MIEPNRIRDFLDDFAILAIDNSYVIGDMVDDGIEHYEGTDILPADRKKIVEARGFEMSEIVYPKTYWCDFCFTETTNGRVCEVCEVVQMLGVKT